MNDVESARFPRLRAALFFKSSDAVDFRLPSIVQCASKDVEDRLRDMGFGVGRMGWEEAYQAKFIISLDGNGATCSRLALALASGCAPLKYVQRHELFYSPALVAGIHYVPIYEDADIHAVLDLEENFPGYFKQIAHDGAIFAEEVLTQIPVCDYISILLERFSLLIGEVAER